MLRSSDAGRAWVERHVRAEGWLPVGLGSKSAAPIDQAPAFPVRFNRRPWPTVSGRPWVALAIVLI